MSEQKKGPTAIDVLSKVSGVPTPEIQAIWKGVEENHAKLRACAGPHDFEEIPAQRPLDKRYRCRKCKGEIRGTDHRWYRDGLVHGRAEAAAEIARLRAPDVVEPKNAITLEVYRSELDAARARIRELEQPKRIVVTRRSDDFHAAIEGSGGRQWDRGTTPDAAIGALVRTHAGALGIEIVEPEASTR